jgi:SagB-type dehydrogenase family enzyme
MSQAFVINPLSRIRLGDGPYGTFVIENVENRRKLSLGVEFADMMFYLVKPHTKMEIINNLEKKMDCTRQVASKLLAELMSAGMIVKNGGKNGYEDWLENDWRNALYFHLLTRGNEYLDAKGEPENQRRKILDAYMQESGMQDFFKEYGKGIKLPVPSKRFVSTSLTMLERRTNRKFAKSKVSLRDLSTILYYSCQPAKAVREYTLSHMEDDSIAYSLSLFTPFEVYFVVNNVSGLGHGLYHYNMKRHSVSLIRKGEFSRVCRKIAIGQNAVANCSAVFFITARFGRYMWRYRHSRAFRNLLIDCSALAHRIVLATVGCGMKNFITPAIIDSRAEKFFGIDGINEAAMYIIGIGN